jgi:predicted MFS family arabinose efflux permease
MEDIQVPDPAEGTSKTGPGTPPRFTPYQAFVVVLLALLQFTVVLDFMVLSPLSDILMKSLHMTTGQFGSVVSVYAFSAGISGFLAAGFADKFDRKKLLMFFYTGFILGTVFCGLANSYEALLIARMITGVFGGVISSIAMAVITDLFLLQQRGRVMGFVQMAFAGSQILGIPIGLYLATTWNWHATFFMVVAIAMAVATLLVVKLKPITEHLKVQHDKNALEHLWHTVRKKDYRTGFMATAILSMGGFLLMPFTSAFLVNNVLIAQEDLPIVFLFTGISSMIVMPVIGKVSDYIDKYRLFTIGSLIAIVLVVIYTNLGPTPIWQVIVINMILFMGVMSRMVPATALNSAVPGVADRGAYMSINSSLQQMAGGLAAVFAGFVVVQEHPGAPIRNFDMLGYIMVGFMLWCLYLVFRVDRIVRRKQPPAPAPQEIEVK